MQIEIVMPKMGESIQEGTILHWNKKEGDRIEKEETLLEISTDKVDSDIPSPASGIIAKIFYEEHETVPVGTVIASIETNHTVHSGSQGKKEEPPKKDLPYQKANDRNEVRLISVKSPGSGIPVRRFYSPVVKSIAHRAGIALPELELLRGSGLNGRIMKNDILQYIEQQHQRKLAGNGESAAGKLRKTDLEEISKRYPPPKYRVVKMDTIQRAMAEHMVRSVAVSPHVTIIDEVEMTEIMNFRLSILQEFERTYGVKLTYTAFFADAIVKALKKYPLLNCSVEGDVVIYKDFINLGIAVAAPSGLIVPVVHAAGEKSFSELARDLAGIVSRARTKKLTPEEVSGGTFSITNFGIFGSVLGTPIINQPQTAILGIGSIKKRPVVIQDELGRDTIGIRSMVYLTLTFDHRVIDGSTGGKFLSSVKWYLENFNIPAA